MVRTALYRLGLELQNLCVLSLHAHTLQDLITGLLPLRWSSRAALNRAKCPTRTMARLRVLQWEAERTDTVGQKGGKKWGKERGPPVCESLITYSSSAFCRLNLNENLFASFAVFQLVAALSLCDSNRSGMWGCKFHLRLSLVFNRDYILYSQSCDSLLSPLIIFFSSFYSFYGSHFYATFRPHGSYRFSYLPLNHLHTV